MNKLISTSLLLLCAQCCTNLSRASDIPMCSGPYAMLNLIDRPSVAFSPCTIPEHTFFNEAGYSYQKLSTSGFGQNLPQIEWRYGLPGNTELDIFPANYNWQSALRQSGFSSSSIGLKHIAYHDEKQLFTLQGYITPSSGGRNFGNRTSEFLINAIYNYNFDSGLGIATLLGFASLTQSPVANNLQYYSVNPIIIVSYPLLKRLTSYLEFYGQSKTSAYQNWGINYDIGLIALASKNLTLDVVYGQRITGLLNNVERYAGLGFVLSLSL